jgi:hypothetical protein
MFVDGSMKNDQASVETATGLTTDQLNTFYATSSTTGTATGSFGDVLLYINQLQSTTWGCLGSSATVVEACTAAEMAPVQWGSAYFTRNPIFSDITSSNGFLTTTYSMCDWTGTPLDACTNNDKREAYAPEYAAYQV